MENLQKNKKHHRIIRNDGYDERLMRKHKAKPVPNCRNCVHAQSANRKGRCWPMKGGSRPWDHFSTDKRCTMYIYIYIFDLVNKKNTACFQAVAIEHGENIATMGCTSSNGFSINSFNRKSASSASLRGLFEQAKIHSDLHILKGKNLFALSDFLKVYCGLCWPERSSKSPRCRACECGAP